MPVDKVKALSYKQRVGTIWDSNKFMKYRLMNDESIRTVNMSSDVILVWYFIASHALFLYQRVTNSLRINICMYLGIASTYPKMSIHNKRATKTQAYMYTLFFHWTSTIFFKVNFYISCHTGWQKWITTYGFRGKYIV